MQVLRIESSWGSKKDQTPQQFVMMCDEWFRALSRFGSKTVADAVSHVIDHHKFQWSGVLPEIVAYCTREDHDWREIYAPDTRQLAPPAEQFERDGRTTEQEIEYRTQQVLEMRKKHGVKTLEELMADETRATPPKQASLDMSVGTHLLNTCAARRARKLPTCHENCSRKACELRERETVQ